MNHRTVKAKSPTDQYAKARFSKAVHALTDNGFTNEEISDLLHVSRQRVGAVMAWKNHRDSWA